MKKIRSFWGAHWRAISATVAAVAVAGFLLLYRLGSLTGTLSRGELAQQAFAGSWHHIASNPLNLPLTGLQWLALTALGHGHTVTRLPSVALGLLALFAFAYVLRRWYGVRTAFFGTVMFATAGWLLHVSRYAGYEVLYLWAVPTLLALHIAWERHSKNAWATFSAMLLIALLLYIPGFFWLVLVVLGLQYQHLLDGWKNLNKIWLRILLIFVFLLALAPLAAAIARHPSLAQSWLGLPHNFSDPGEIPRRLAQTVSFLIWRGPLTPALWLDRLPVLSIFAAAMALLGVLFYAKHWQAPRTRLLAGTFIIGAVFYALGGPVGFSVLIPIIYLVIAGGVGYLLHEWLRVFPRNPLARAVGYTLIAFLIGLNCLYTLRSYYIAWPHSPATKAAFRNQG